MPRLSTLARLAEALGVARGELFADAVVQIPSVRKGPPRLAKGRKQRAEAVQRDSEPTPCAAKKLLTGREDVSGPDVGPECRCVRSERDGQAVESRGRM